MQPSAEMGITGREVVRGREGMEVFAVRVARMLSKGEI